MGWGERLGTKAIKVHVGICEFGFECFSNALFWGKKVDCFECVCHAPLEKKLDFLFLHIFVTCLVGNDTVLLGPFVSSAIGCFQPLDLRSC